MEANKYFLEYMASFSEDYLNLVKKDFETSSDFSVDDMITFSKPYHEINENVVRSFLAKLRKNEITAPQSLAYSETLDIQQYLPLSLMRPFFVLLKYGVYFQLLKHLCFFQHDF